MEFVSLLSPRQMKIKCYSSFIRSFSASCLKHSENNFIDLGTYLLGLLAIIEIWFFFFWVTVFWGKKNFICFDVRRGFFSIVLVKQSDLNKNEPL